MPLKGGDRWFGLDTLTVRDESLDETLLEGVILTDMDIDPEKNVVTMYVSGDISYGNTD